MIFCCSTCCNRRSSELNSASQSCSSVWQRVDEYNLEMGSFAFSISIAKIFLACVMANFACLISASEEDCFFLLMRTETKEDCVMARLYQSVKSLRSEEHTSELQSQSNL